MNCPICQHSESAVIRTEADGQDRIRRRRQCCQCKHRWTTFESAVDTAGELEKLKSALKPVAELIR